MQSQKHKFKCGVDAGNISVGSLHWYESQGAVWDDKSKRLCHRIDGLKPGWYQVTVSFDGWDGETSKSDIIFVERPDGSDAGSLVVGDCCYLFREPKDGEPDQWHAFLDVTHHLQYGNNNFFSVDTGGDGGFQVEVELRETEEPSDAD